MKNIGDRAREYREARGWTTTLMAKHVGTSRQNIENLEAKPDMVPRYVAKLAKALGLTVDDLISGHATAPMPTVQATDGPTIAHFEQRAGQRRRSADIDVVDCFIDLLARAEAPVLEAMAGLLPALARNPSNQQIVRSVRALFEPEAFPAKVQNNG